jgi:hypothetical protein
LLRFCLRAIELDAWQVLTQQGVEIWGTAALADRLGLVSHCAQAPLAVGDKCLDRSGSGLTKRGIMLVSGGELGAKLGHDLQQDLANELFHVAAKGAVRGKQRAFARATWAAAEGCAVEEPGRGAPVVLARTRHMGGGLGVEPEYGAADAAGEGWIVLCGVLHGAGRNAEQAGGFGFGESGADESAEKAALLVVEA